ncbi:MAG TPA: hypothetical protein EYG03_17470 [Planctomycetes bacterium]|nr:hypothetical protein [Fuerstiella sp.]HIK93741.1 hypothetical protein [Planctomycetota bacterium]
MAGLTQLSAQTDDSPTIPWLFSPMVDLLTFTGSAVVALTLVWLGHARGWLTQDTPEWLWVSAILLLDVAHVYATGFRVYFDPTELRRRPWLYGLAPVLAFVLGWAVYSESSTAFWRVLAYLAVFHFIRQQYGWVALYRTREANLDRRGRWLDSLAIYAATVYPLIYWHCHLPRQFWWFLDDDFMHLPAALELWCRPLYWLTMVTYFGTSAWRAWTQGIYNPGKDLVVLTTAICWYVGIVSCNSDYAFTVTNVIIHGVPYMILVYWHRWGKADSVAPTNRFRTVAMFLGVIWILAYVEELLWDTGVWHERPWLFGTFENLEQHSALLVPLLAVPQITHYVLDGFIWRRRSNDRLAELTEKPRLNG